MGFVPKSIRRKLLGVVRSQYVKYLNQQTAQVPTLEFTRQHLENIQFLPNREQLLELLPQNAVVAELGVDQGCFSEKILQINTPQKLHLVDVWGTKRFNQQKRQHVKQKFAAQLSSGQVEINLGLSTSVVKDFPDNYFDWIYVDTDHSYNTTLAELQSYRTKVKENGIIAGHDFMKGSWHGLVKYGVMEAVCGFCQSYNWELIYLTAEINTAPSFAIREKREEMASVLHGKKGKVSSVSS